MTTLARLARSKTSEERPRILSTTVNALVQRVPPRARIAAETFSAAPGNMVDTNQLVAWLETNGFLRTGTVRDTANTRCAAVSSTFIPPVTRTRCASISSATPSNPFAPSTPRRSAPWGRCEPSTSCP
jgi:hypothetical protein